MTCAPEELTGSHAKRNRNCKTGVRLVPRRFPQDPFATLARSTRPDKPAKQAGLACRTAKPPGRGACCSRARSASSPGQAARGASAGPQPCCLPPMVRASWCWTSIGPPRVTRWRRSRAAATWRSAVVMSPAAADAEKTIARAGPPWPRRRAGQQCRDTAPDRLLDVTDALHDRVMDVNMRGCFDLTQAVVPAVRAAGSSSIVNMSSEAGQRAGGVFGGTPCAAAKAAILGYSKACARRTGRGQQPRQCGLPLADRHRHDGRRDLPPAPQRDPGNRADGVGRHSGKKWPAAACSWHHACPAISQGSESDVKGGSHIH